MMRPAKQVPGAGRGPVRPIASRPGSQVMPGKSPERRRRSPWVTALASTAIRTLRGGSAGAGPSTAWRTSGVP